MYSRCDDWCDIIFSNSRKSQFVDDSRVAFITKRKTNFSIDAREEMRLDKFLKVYRIIERRSVVKEVADKGRIQINGKLAKSSSTLKVGDILQIQFGNKTLEVKVLALQDSTKKEDASKMYEILSEKRIEA